MSSLSISSSGQKLFLPNLATSSLFVVALMLLLVRRWISPLDRTTGHLQTLPVECFIFLAMTRTEASGESFKNAAAFPLISSRNIRFFGVRAGFVVVPMPAPEVPLADSDDLAWE